MRLVSFCRSGESRSPQVGALLSEAEIFTFDHAPVWPAERFDGSPGSWLSKQAALFRQAEADPVRAAEFRKQRRIVRLSDVRLLAPVPRPGKIICLGMNYRGHAEESKLPVPAKPVIFSKFSTCVIGPDEPVVLPLDSSEVDYEAELAVVIGKRAIHVDRQSAMDCVLGYTILNDVSARDFQFGDGQWVRGKSCDTFAPMGPWIVTTDSLPDPHDLAIRLTLNGELMQNARTSEFVFPIPDVISFLSRNITLEPGDVIATGTPTGVGFSRTPPVFLRHGDVLQIEIERLGVLRNPVVAHRSGDIEVKMANLAGGARVPGGDLG